MFSKLRAKAPVGWAPATMVLGALIILLTGACVFLLPFFFPPTHPALSASYAAGFNNRVAAVGAATVSAIAFLLLLRFGGMEVRGEMEADANDRLPISRFVLLGCLTACAAFTAGIGWMLTRATMAYNDNLYFMEFMDEVTTYHLHVYRDFSFLYGPVLIYFPAAVSALLRPFHIGTQGAYYIALILMQAAGQLLLFFTLEALPLSKKTKTLLLCLFTLCVMGPLMGLNYTFVRSLLPFSTLLFAIRARNPFLLSALFFFGEMLQLSVSPELGVAFAAGACFYACSRLHSAGISCILAVAAPILGAAMFLVVAGREYLNSMALFSSGCLNLIVQPLPYILFFLLAVVWLIPRMLAREVLQGSLDAPAMLSLFVVCLGMLPAALGRCDPLHVFFNGVGVYLLAAVAISSCSKRVRGLWILGLEVNLVWMQVVNFTLYLPALVFAARTDLGLRPGAAEDPVAAISAMERTIARGKVSAPFLVPQVVEAELKRAKLYQPDRECFYIGVWNGAAEKARVERMDGTEWALIPAANQLITETRETSDLVDGGGFAYPQRQPSYTYGTLIYRDLAERWTPVSKTEEWILYHNDRFPSLGGHGVQ